MKYGTIPIVRATGGLDDTIENCDLAAKRGTGFKFNDATVDALVGTVAWAVDLWYRDKEAIEMLKRNAMAQRFSWEEAAASYADIYRLAMMKRRCRKHQ